MWMRLTMCASCCHLCVLVMQILLVMGPWQHVGPESHVAGEVDFGVNALISGNLAPSVYSFTRRWFERFVEPATAPGQQPKGEKRKSGSLPADTQEANSGVSDNSSSGSNSSGDASS